MAGAATITEPIVLPQGATLRLSHQSALDNLDVALDFSGTLVADTADLELSGDLTVNGTLVVNGLLTLTGDIHVPGFPGIITHEAGVLGSHLVIDGDLTIGLGARWI